ncbi:MAG: GWxTD domain-containing protein [Bacteroidales bacterium]
MTKTKIALLLGVFILSFFACRQTQRVSTYNLAHLYNPQQRFLNPVYNLRHVSADQSILRLEIPSDELLFVRESREEHLTARFRLHCMLFDSFESKQMIDSVQKTFRDTLSSSDPYLISREVSIALNAGLSGVLLITLEDLNRRISDTYMMPVDKSSPMAPGFFTMTVQAHTHSFPFFASVNQTISLGYADSTSFSMRVDYFGHIQQIPLPPSVNIEDSHVYSPAKPALNSFRLDFTRGAASFSPAQEGIYHLYEPGNPQHGFVILVNDTGFPAMIAAGALVRPLRYISSRDEFEALLTYPDARLATERFWTRSAGNPDRSAELRRRYYTRAEQANVLFSSFVQGWQSDRGMIYIIFGPPQRVYRTDRTETWYYPEGVNIPAVQFSFHKWDNPFSSNHFILERNTMHRSAWNQAVNVWRR